jgi:GNAT superfamily N-acetyltransferase
MIREARFDELKNCTQLLTTFWKEIGLEEDYRHTEARVKNLLFTFMTTANCCVLVDDQLRGVLIGHINEHPIWSHKVGTEIGWWIDPSSRNLKLANSFINSFEEWCKERGADFVVFGSHPSGRSAAKLYERQKYRPFEVTHIKRI